MYSRNGSFKRDNVGNLVTGDGDVLNPVITVPSGALKIDIGQDGTVIDGVQSGRFANLPLLVGQGADTSAKAILAALEPYPDLRKNIYAIVRVGDRRWNLRLTNGMDVKLPEHGTQEAIAAFVKLDKSSQLSDRDITEVDMRRPGTATVRLSDEAAAALAAKAKEKDKAAGT